MEDPPSCSVRQSVTPNIISILPARNPPEHDALQAVYLHSHRELNCGNAPKLRRKRVPRACGRCRLKKTKCDSGSGSCKRCQRDGYVCTTEPVAQSEHKKLSPGYADLFEQTHSALMASVEKLYLMVRNGDHWDLGDPEKDNEGHLVILDIVRKLGCLKRYDNPNSPIFSTGSKDKADLGELVRKPGDQDREPELAKEDLVHDTDSTSPCQIEETLSSDDSPKDRLNGFDCSATQLMHYGTSHDAINFFPQSFDCGYSIDLTATVQMMDTTAPLPLPPFLLDDPTQILCVDQFFHQSHVMRKEESLIPSLVQYG